MTRLAEPAGVAHRLNLGIQGLRGVAILLVLLNHAEVPGFGGGFVGVDVFFVISGYLIGGLLLRELDRNQHIDLWAFYGRRVRRLLPAVAVLMAVTLVGVRWLYAPQEQDELFSSMRAAALYAINLWFASRPTDYFGGHTEANPLLHLWSLAVEEQFYLFWPLLLIATARIARLGARAATTALVLGLGSLSFTACVWMSLVNYKYAFFLTPFRIWEFAVGMAVMLIAPKVTAWRPAVVSALGAVAVVVLAVVSWGFEGRMRYPGAWAAIPVLCAAGLLIVAQQQQSTSVGRLLQMRWLRWVGDSSYSIYLWHWPVLILLTMLVPQPGAWWTGGAIALSIGLGWLSYRGVEQPFIHVRLQGWSPKQINAAGLALCVLLVGATQGIRRQVTVGPEQQAFIQAARWDQVEKTGCLVLAPAVDQPPCEFGPADAQRTVVLFGDSHAAQWFPALRRLADEQGFRLHVLTKSACPSVSAHVAVYTTFAPYRECDVWRERMFERVEALKPDVILLANSTGYELSLDIWKSGLADTVTRLKRTGAAIGYLRDIPFPGFDVPLCHARAAWRGWSLGEACTYAAAEEERRIGGWVRTELATLSPHGVRYIDLSAHLCQSSACPTSAEGRVFFKDRNHLTEAFSSDLAPVLKPILSELIPPNPSP
ncbi:acyltransferase family protein [Roseateles sp. BYS87W]|uniref:Acyltransferase family protein n=1 Tax=Pelomonas baiyunensis TaxID=3299026 RepID=A0ABW7GXJ4_9BURK